MSRPTNQIASLKRALDEHGLNIDTAYANRSFLSAVLNYLSRLEGGAKYAIGTQGMADEMREAGMADAIARLEEVMCR